MNLADNVTFRVPPEDVCATVPILTSPQGLRLFIDGTYKCFVGRSEEGKYQIGWGAPGIGAGTGLQLVTPKALAVYMRHNSHREELLKLLGELHWFDLLKCLQEGNGA